MFNLILIFSNRGRQINKYEPPQTWKSLKTPEALINGTTTVTFAIPMESWLNATPNVSPVCASCKWIRCGGCLFDGQSEYIAVSLVIWPKAKTNARLTYNRKDARAKTTKINMKIVAKRRPLLKTLIARKYHQIMRRKKSLQNGEKIIANSAFLE